MTSTSQWAIPSLIDRAASDVLAVLPARASDMRRLRILAQQELPPTVTVIGKYNHGKSRLLNELIGQDVFAFSDRRETVVLTEHVTRHARWLDAPGLDADVSEHDDLQAHQAVWFESDVRLFVHAAKEGELDEAERTLLRELRADQARTHRQTIFVLTQVDQLAGDAQLDIVTSALRVQLPSVVIHPVSVTRHRQGAEQGKPLLLERSGVLSLQNSIQSALAQVSRSRAHETALLSREIRGQLQQMQTAAQTEYDALIAMRHWQRQDFDQGLAAVLAQVSLDLQPLLIASGTDPALVPDSFETMFKITAGKRERALLQIAYSNACIAINGHLVRHGVVGLPVGQQTSVRSLDTVMVAVMGVSVKYRDDLRRLFSEQAGQERLQHEFSRYFELSQERVEQSQNLIAAESQISLVAKAIGSLCALDPGCIPA